MAVIVFEIGNPWGLAAFLSVPAVVFLHYFRTRFTRHIVPAVFLWEQEKERSPEGASFQRIRRSGSLICEILAAVILSLLISGASCSAERSFRHRIVFLDNSLSMTAVHEGKPFYREAVRACGSLCSRDAETLYTVIEAGSEPRVIAGPFSPLPRVKAALREWKPASFTSDLGKAAEFTAQFRRSAEGSVLFTDHIPEDRPGNMRVISAGAPVPNCGITAARRLRGTEGKETVFIAVRNFSDSAQSRRIVVEAQGKELRREEIRFSGGQSVRLTFSLSGGRAPVAVKLAEDSFAADDSVYLLPEPNKEVRVLNGLEADPGISRLVSIIPDTVMADTPEDANIVFAPAGAEVHEDEFRWVFSIGPGKGEHVHISDGFLMDRTHPFLRGVTLDGVIWGGAGKAEKDIEPLISAGPHFLMFRSKRNGLFRINMDPGKTNFFKSIDWPVLFSNIVEQMRSGLPGLERSNYILGEQVLYYAAPQLRGIECTAERDGTVLYTAVLSDVHLVRKAGRQGIYTLKAEGKTIARFSVNFINPLESDFRKASPGDTGEAGDPGRITLKRKRQWISPLLILAALFFLGLDWIILRSG